MKLLDNLEFWNEYNPKLWMFESKGKRKMII